MRGSHVKLTIETLGARGDGIAKIDGRAVFVPFTLAGEVVEAEGELPHLTLNEVLTKSANRVSPPCPHFGTCGGCSLQHADAPTMLDWKRQKVVDCFAAEGLSPEIGTCVASDIASRRRVTFTAQRTDDGVVLGFKERASDDLVGITACSILLPQIADHIATFTKLCASILRGREEIQLTVTACDNGLDLSFALPQELTSGLTADFVRAFAKTNFIRASANGDILVEREKPIVTFGKAHVAVPSGGFLQAVEAIEQEMARLVIGHLKKSKRVVDLFCGSGTFALRLAQRAKVHAVESEKTSLEALQQASGADGLKPVTTEKRDLFEAPMTAKELSSFDGICLDPPRAGAQAQVAEIIKTDIARLAYVSCNPQTLARDAAELVKAGFALDQVTPLDQFLFSPHVEVVALFSRKMVGRKKSIFGRKV